MNPDSKRSGRRRVLVAEDDFFVASSLTTALEAEGVDVLGPVATVAEAMNLAVGNQSVDGAVLDINLGGEMVYPVADALRERRVPYVFTTGYDTDSVAQRAPDAPCFEKPVVVGQLLAALFDRD